MRAALYHRVSTTDQDPGAARHELRAAATARGHSIAMEVEETGSGARNDRPGLQQVMAAARRGHIDAVLVWKLDRFGRSTLDVLTNLNHLAAAGVRFEAVTHGLVVDPRRFDPTAQLILTVLAAVAAFEREIIRERTLLGLARARRAGRRLGRPPLYHVDPDRVREVRAEGKSWRQLAALLGCSIDAARRAWRKRTPEGAS